MQTFRFIILLIACFIDLQGFDYLNHLVFNPEVLLYTSIMLFPSLFMEIVVRDFFHGF